MPNGLMVDLEDENISSSEDEDPDKIKQQSYTGQQLNNNSSEDKQGTHVVDVF
jgi:hypothetical protein